MPRERCCDNGYLDELHWCLKIPLKPHPPELTSFDRLARLEGKLDTLAKGQGRLMARLDEHDAWAKDLDGVEDAKYNARCEAFEATLRAGLKGISDGTGKGFADLLREFAKLKSLCALNMGVACRYQCKAPKRKRRAKRAG